MSLHLQKLVSSNVTLFIINNRYQAEVNKFYYSAEGDFQDYSFGL